MRLSATSTSITAKGFVGTSGSTPPASDTTAQVTFKYHMHGEDHSTLKAYIVPHNGTGSLLTSIVGEQQSTNSSTYTTVSYNIDQGGIDFRGQDVRLFFIIEFASTGFKQDVALDAIHFIINGTTYDYSAQTSGDSALTARARWRQKRQIIASAPWSTSGSTDIKVTSTYNWYWKQFHGQTPSSGTGPYYASNANFNTNYFLFEASGGSGVDAAYKNTSTFFMYDYISIPA